MKRMALARKNSSSNAASRAEPVSRQPRLSYVLCVRNRGYRASLELRKVYRRIADTWAQSHGLIRIVDESGEDYLEQCPSARHVPRLNRTRILVKLSAEQQ
jgi:hypothetical protein